MVNDPQLERWIKAQMDPRVDWDDYFLGVAAAVSVRGECTRAQIGAIIVLEHRIVATGYNGAPAGHANCFQGACPRARLSYAERSHNEGDYNDCVAIHAEANAIINSREPLLGGILYCTHEPCYGCLKLLTGAGVVEVITPSIRMDLTVHAN